MTRPRRVALVSTPKSIHTIKWANGLSSIGQEVHLIGLDPSVPEGLASEVNFHQLNPSRPTPKVQDYFKFWIPLRKKLQELKPDLVNSHYASSYAAVTSLSVRGLKLPHLLNVWGSDVYEFPNRSVLHKQILKASLSGATVVASTSHCMAEETRKYCKKPTVITPFGVDTDVFYPRSYSRQEDKSCVIGTVKTMASTYGIDVLIKAFALLKNRTEIPVELHLYGGGPAMDEYKALAKECGIEVFFGGQISHGEVPEALASFGVFAALSREESFGVAVLEAGAMGLPAVVSDAPGLVEVVLDEKTGFVVSREDPEAACDALQKLVEDEMLRDRMGANALGHVRDNYSWTKSLESMVEAQDVCIRSFHTR